MDAQGSCEPSHRRYSKKAFSERGLESPIATKAVADAVAKKMAIEWIVLQFPSAAD